MVTGQKPIKPIDLKIIFMVSQLTAPGFYVFAGEGRLISDRVFLDMNLSLLIHRGLKITNIEMETAGIYSMPVLSHKAIS